jgi:hypothetical protein
MKKCPYCAEEIQNEAIKCKHCSEFLDGSKPLSTEANSLPWYFKTPTMILSFCTVGPLALPMVWFHPKLNWIWKLVITAVVGLATWQAYVATQQLMKMMDEQFKMLQSGII